MLKRIFLFIVIAYIPTMGVLLVGCADEQKYTPRITGVVSSLNYRGRGFAARAEALAVSKPSYSSSAWYPSTKAEKDWNAIIIHHSATEKGSMAVIDDYHRNVNGWDGIGYDFVIGNGTGSGNGQIESTYRWKYQKTGAHCKTDYTNWANREAVGICLVGNFNESRPSVSQMDSLVKLVRFLGKKYDIPLNRIYGHRTTPGHSTVTSCPGDNFSMYTLKARI